MPVVTLFGPPEPEDQKVVGTADVVNYFPKLNLQGQLLWEQRPGLTPSALLGVVNVAVAGSGLAVAAPSLGTPLLTEAAAFVCEGGLECTHYPTDYGNLVDVWDIDNVTKTFHCSAIVPEAQDELGLKSGLLTSAESLPFPDQKRTVTLVYRTVDNPSFFTEVIDAEGSPANLSFTNSAPSKRVHFNISELQNFYLVFWSWTGAITGSYPDLVTEYSGEIYIECLQLEARDWEAANESLLVVYDETET